MGGVTEIDRETVVTVPEGEPLSRYTPNERIIRASFSKAFALVKDQHPECGIHVSALDKPFRVFDVVVEAPDVPRYEFELDVQSPTKALLRYTGSSRLKSVTVTRSGT